MSERLPKELSLELPVSLEDQGVELRIVLSIQPLTSHPLPTSDTGSPVELGPKSLDNPVQTLKSFPAIDSQPGLIIYLNNPFFDPIVI